MKDYTKSLPKHIEKYVGENDLFLEIFMSEECLDQVEKRPPLLFVHGAYTGSWMWSKFIPHFISNGWNCYVMNMRGHYKSRAMDLTKVIFEDYLEDIKEIIKECSEPPIIIGFSMGGILCQKICETNGLTGLVLIDSSISRQVYEKVPYQKEEHNLPGIVVPAPDRNEEFSIDESPEDIAFQKKYLSMESTKAFLACSYPFGAKDGISVNHILINCPCLVMKAINNEKDDKRGRAEAEHLSGEYTAFRETTHTGLLLGQRYLEVVDRMIEWLRRFI